MKPLRYIYTITLLALVALAGIANGANEPEPDRVIDLLAQKLGPGVQAVADDGSAYLTINNEGGTAGPKLLFELIHPGIAKDSYALTGEVRYKGVEGAGYLETWNHFPAQAGSETIAASYFSRTLGESGPMGKITGDSDWRTFSLPFFANDSERRPLKITFNAQFPGAGRIDIRTVHLIDGLPGTVHTFAGGGWWSPRASGWIGAAFGVVFGIWGTCLRMFAAKGTALAFTRSSLVAWIVFGIPAALAGCIALAMGQPYHVWFFLLFFGALSAAIGGWELVKLRKLETELELRKMTAADLT